ncbi:CPBP family intramembrane glutamic endopeptidase [Dyella agri]|uniref:CPBP family intramembrane metalloprotease n=1 Tax=Dyella agri TaxID=1926869 RepID=A0ABW8KFN7_9GAMM
MLATFAVAILALYLLIAEPLLGRRAHNRLLSALDAGRPDARRRFYRRWIWQGWALLLVTLIVTLGLAGWAPARLGLGWPHWPAGVTGGLLVGLAAGVGLASASGLVTSWMKTRQRKGMPPAQPLRVGNGYQLLRMLPRTPAERRSFAALSLTAGITEEVIWRGFGLGLLFALLPQAPVAVSIVLAALAFGWAHLYQGRTGILVTGVLGGLFAWLYWATGSLLLPMLLHVLVDLRAAFLPVPADAPAMAGTPAP